MITVNLLPRQQRRVERKTINLPYKPVLILAAGLLIFLHVLLLTFFSLKSAQLFFLKQTWASLEGDTKLLNSTKTEIRDLEGRVTSMKTCLTRPASFTQLFSVLTRATPGGLWLERFSYSEQGLVIQGSVISLDQDEMTIIGKFLQDIKSQPSFEGLFSKIELSSVQRRKVKTFDVVDFVLLGDLKGQEAKK